MGNSISKDLLRRWSAGGGIGCACRDTRLVISQRSRAHVSQRQYYRYGSQTLKNILYMCLRDTNRT